MRSHLLVLSVGAGIALLLLGLAVAAPGDYGATYGLSLAPNPSQNPADKPQTFLDGLTPGKTYVVQVSATNTGKLTWVKNEYKLSYRWLGPETSFPYDFVTYPPTDLPSDQVAPGETVTFNAALKVPLTPGTYTLWWDMVRQGVFFFSEVPCCPSGGTASPPGKQSVGVGGRVGSGQGQIGTLK
jgi:Ig-like domain from next to BRCA1 gene